jgi:hypothetical protein
MILKQIKFDEADIEAAMTVQRLYGCDSFSQAVRLATRIAASQARVSFPVPPSPKFSHARRARGSVEGILPLPAGFDADAFDAVLAEAARRHAFTWREPARPRRKAAKA